MQIVHAGADLPAGLRGAVAAIGNFDGVHRGHQALVREAFRLASGRPVLVLTFEPHPRRYFVPDVAPFQIDTLAQKARWLEALDVRALVALRFDASLAALSPEQFVRDVLVQDLGIAGAVVGYDFTFGKARAGSTDYLVRLGREVGIQVAVVAAQGDTGGAFSSSRIRMLLEAGEPAAAAAILGRLWEVEGRVLHGDKRGRTIGFPTANVDIEGYLVPRLGVYAVEVEHPGDGRRWKGVANLGRRPTFGKEGVTLEVNLFDFTGDLYGQTLRVGFAGFLRPEQKFAGLEALRAQISADAAAARTLLAGAVSTGA